jgi:hypothetical protein
VEKGSPHETIIGVQTPTLSAKTTRRHAGLKKTIKNILYNHKNAPSSMIIY